MAIVGVRMENPQFTKVQPYPATCAHLRSRPSESHPSVHCPARLTMAFEVQRGVVSGRSGECRAGRCQKGPVGPCWRGCWPSMTVSRPLGSRAFCRYQSREWPSLRCEIYSASGFVACRSTVSAKGTCAWRWSARSPTERGSQSVGPTRANPRPEPTEPTCGEVGCAPPVTAADGGVPMGGWGRFADSGEGFRIVGTQRGSRGGQLMVWGQAFRLRVASFYFGGRAWRRRANAREAAATPAALDSLIDRLGLHVDARHTRRAIQQTRSALDGALGCHAGSWRDVDRFGRPSARRAVWALHRVTAAVGADSLAGSFSGYGVAMRHLDILPPGPRVPAPAPMPRPPAGPAAPYRGARRSRTVTGRCG